MKNVLILLLIGLFVSSCTSKRNLTYFSDLPQNASYQAAIVNAYEPTIQKGDILSITVSSLDAASNAMFNTGTLQTGMTKVTGIGASADLGKEGYLVGGDGHVNFPIIGQIQLKDLTLTQAHEKMQRELIKYVKEPIVNIRYLNFKITVIGEVQKPTTFVIPNDRINVLEALGMAGDMTVYGKRQNVLVIREENGERNMVRLDFNSKDVFSSPYFYLKQNDIVYVEPSALRDPSGERTLRIVSTIATVITAASLLIFRVF